MARKSIDFTVTTPGRDLGKTFVITEMPASQAEEWAIRVLLLGGGIELPDGAEKGGMAALADIGLKTILAGVKWSDAKPLVEEMFSCVRIKPDPSKPMIIRNLIEEDIEEIQTRVTLRGEVFKLHTGFLEAGAASKSTSAVPPPA